jgi:hypothetical protein
VKRPSRFAGAKEKWIWEFPYLFPEAPDSLKPPNWRKPMKPKLTR